MENNKEEEKTKEIIEPMLDLKNAMEELGFDPKHPDFKEEMMISKFRQLSEDNTIHFFQRDRYKSLLAALSEHKFWDS